MALRDVGQRSQRFARQATAGAQQANTLTESAEKRIFILPIGVSSA
jgi:hypothetical protein